MSALYLMIAFSLLIALVFLAAFLWAMRNGQYEDTHTPALRVLFDKRGKTKYDANKEEVSS